MPEPRDLSAANVRYSWTQPCCVPCWNERNPERHAIPGYNGGEPECCVYCGQSTKSGIYVRENPTTREILVRVADALHDAAWVMAGAEAAPPLMEFVLPQTKRVEAEIRALISALDAEVKRA